MRMWQRFWQLPIFSTLLVLINLVVFCMDFISGFELQYLGGMQKTAVLQYGEYGRLLWAMFLHADAAHLFNNMIILFFLGAMLEKEVGHIWLPAVYFLSGIGGNILSLAVKVAEKSEAITIGASGAVFGLDGLLLMLVLLSPKFRDTATPARVILMILLSIYDGFYGQNVDNAAHIGGLLVGILMGLMYMFIQRIKNRKYGEVQA